MKYLRPDSKSQVTVEYDDNNKPLRIDTIVISTSMMNLFAKRQITQAEQVAEKAMQQKIGKDIEKILIPRVKKTLPARIQKLFNNDFNYWSTHRKICYRRASWDTGLTGRKIIVDTYGGHGLMVEVHFG